MSDEETDEEVTAEAGSKSEPDSTSPDSKGGDSPSDASEQEGGESSEDIREAVEPSVGEKFNANMRTILGAVLLALFIRIVLFQVFEIDGPSMQPTLRNGDRIVVSKFSYGLFLPFMHEAVLNWASPDRGEVLIIQSPADEEVIVKRVIGIAGDTIEAKKEQVSDERGGTREWLTISVNGERITQGPLLACTDEGDRHTRSTPCGSEEDRRIAGTDSDPCRRVKEVLDGREYHVSTSYGLAGAGEPFLEGDTRTFTVPEGHVFVMGDHRDHSNDSRAIGPIPIERVQGKALAIYWSNCGGIRWDRIFNGVD